MLRDHQKRKSHIPFKADRKLFYGYQKYFHTTGTVHQLSEGLILLKFKENKSSKTFTNSPIPFSLMPT